MDSSFLQFSSILTQWHNLFHRGFPVLYSKKMDYCSIRDQKQKWCLTKKPNTKFPQSGDGTRPAVFFKFFQPPPFILYNYSHSHLSRFRLHCRCSLRHFHLNRFHHHYPKGLLRTLHPHRMLQWMNRHRSPRPSAHGFR